MEGGLAEKAREIARGDAALMSYLGNQAGEGTPGAGSGKRVTEGRAELGDIDMLKHLDEVVIVRVLAVSQECCCIAASAVAYFLFRSFHCYFVPRFGTLLHAELLRFLVFPLLQQHVDVPQLCPTLCNPLTRPRSWCPLSRLVS